MRHFSTISGIPDKSALIAGKVERIIKKSVIGLITCREFRSHVALSKGRSGMEDKDASHRIRAIHKTCRTFQDLYGMNRSRVDFYSVFIAPLLSFLSYSIIHYDHTVKSQSTNHGFGDSASRGNLRNAWLMSDGVDDVGRRLHFELAGRNERDGCRQLLELLAASQSRNHHFVQFHARFRQRLVLDGIAGFHTMNA